MTRGGIPSSGARRKTSASAIVVGVLLVARGFVTLPFAALVGSRRSCHARHTSVESLYGLSAANSAAVCPLFFQASTRADHIDLVDSFMHLASHFQDVRRKRGSTLRIPNTHVASASGSAA
jgi:hypothetical protein